jgi:hypothetical protein
VDDDTLVAPLDSPDGSQLRPQSLMLAFFGNHVLEEGPCALTGQLPYGDLPQALVRADSRGRPAFP